MGYWTLLCVLLPAAQGQEPTFGGLFADGNYVAGGRISEWHDTAAQPKLNGQLLLDPASADSLAP